MIYTITFNPAIDYILEVDKLEINEINRAKAERILAGGKGINVSIVLKNLGIDSIALGFLGGFTGQEIKRKIEKLGIKTDFVYIKNKSSRINVKLQTNAHGKIIEETAINSDGPEISEEEVNELIKKIEKIEKGDFIVISGSIARNMNENIYERICSKAKEKEIKIVVDTTGKYLLTSLKYNPFLVKPNKKELEEIFKTKINSKEEVIAFAQKLQENGAENVLISMDQFGAVLLTKDKKILYSTAPKGQLVNSVGSGDSMVAGFLTGFIMYDDYEKALKLGISAGSASAFSKELATKDEILYQYSKIKDGG